MASPLKSTRFILSVSPDWLDTVDEWRRQQPDIPSRAEAVRRLVDLGLGEKPKPDIAAGAANAISKVSQQIAGKNDDRKITQPHRR